jgi:UDP-N-acetyl-D-glucosamine dehydrogenase
MKKVIAAEMSSLTESVAKLVTVTNQIGHACHVLEQAGHKAVLAKNRIDVDDLVSAQYVGGAAPLKGRTVAVVGMGYVGLPTALSLADNGADEVIGFDVSEGRLADIKADRVDLLPRDHMRLQLHLGRDSLTLTTEPQVLTEVDAILICVPTPIDAHHSPDLRAVRDACAVVVDHARAGQTIMLTSTTYVGCTRALLVLPLIERGLAPGKDVFIAFAPERIDPGVANHCPEATPRVVGGVTSECARQAESVLRHTAASLHRVSSPEAAEMTKVLENTYRAVNIALINEFAGAAAELGVDVIEVIEAAATKPYGFTAFYPGPGVGGHCIPCDPHYLLWQLRARRVNMPVISTAMTAIALRPREVVAQARTMLAENGTPTKEARVLVVGVAYKPGVADVRESPALEIIEELLNAEALVSFTDPMVERLSFPDGTLTSCAAPERGMWDLVILIHPDGGHYNGSPVLDTTYRRARSAR